MAGRVRESAAAVLRLAHRAAFEPELWPPLLRAIAAHLGAANAFVHRHALRAGCGEVVVGIDLVPELVACYPAEFARHNPFVARGAGTYRPGLVGRGFDLVDEHEVIASDFYRHWMRPQGLHHALGGTLAIAGDEIWNLSVTRPPEAAPFDATEKGRLARLMPDLVLAAAHARRVAELEGRLRALEVLAEALPLGAVQLRGDRVAWSNAEGRRLVERRAGVVTEGQRLVTRDAAWGAALSARAAGDEALLVRRDTGSSLEVLRLGGEDDGVSAFDRGEPRRWVLLNDPQRQRVQRRALETLLELTEQQAQVALLVATGLTPEEIASELDLGIATVRTHLSNAFRRTGTRGQAGLAARVAASLAGWNLGADAPR